MTNDEVAYLRSTTAIREKCDHIFNLGCADQLSHFWVDLTNLDKCADYVIRVMGDEYPNLEIPFHSRWRHFEVGNVSRISELNQALANLSPIEKAKVKFDLAIISVLLDAGAGANWQYYEKETKQTFQRSEGLAVASFRMFCQGTFSSNFEQPWQVDGKALQHLNLEILKQGFQVSSENPLVGVEGRLKLLQRLGEVISQNPTIFGKENPRPGNMLNYLLREKLPPDVASSVEQGSAIDAIEVLKVVLEGLGEIWPGRLAIANINLGDVWIHPALEGKSKIDQYIPFHKLSQWLTYSLLEPLEEIGFAITGLDKMTGLAEYRNGGLCLDTKLIQVKNSAILSQPHLPGSEIIVEWRALTVSLLDRIAAKIRQKLNLTSAELPLVKVLQGGTWTAGRKIAAELRKGGTPPITIESDGTVF